MISERGAPDFERLLDWLEGRLPEEEAKAVAAQLERAGDAVQADFAWLAAFLRLSRGVVLASPPAELRSQLVNRFVAHHQGQPARGLWQLLVATLTFDSRVRPAVNGLRATQTAEPQQLIFSTDLADIVLNIQRRRHMQRLDLWGQVLPNGGRAVDTFSVQLLQGTAEVGITTTDELGEFRFSAIPPGRYEMVLSAHQVEIRVAPLALDT